MMTRQGIFDKAWTGLKAQGFMRSMRGKGCAYRGAEGRRCAIGHCIPDAAYRDEWEGRRYDAFAAIGLPRMYQDEHEFYWGVRLQGCHDSGRTPAGMEENLRDFARKHNLTIPGEESQP
jgi:hypothetical protein